MVLFLEILDGFGTLVRFVETEEAQVGIGRKDLHRIIDDRVVGRSLLVVDRFGRSSEISHHQISFRVEQM